MLKKILFILLISFSAFPQQNGFDSTVTTGIKQIYSIDFENAENTFRKLIADYPGHPAGRFFLAMIDWWKILLDPDNESYDDIFFQKLEDVIYQCDEILDDDPENVDALFFKGGAIGFRGRLNTFRESWLKAADDGREALPIVEHAYNLDPTNVDVQLGFGIYNYYAGVIPNEYPLIKPLMIFFPDGDKQKGIEQLTLTAENGKYAKYEAKYFLMTLYYRFEKDFPRAQSYAESLFNEFPNNPVFEKWLGRISVRRGNYIAADSVFRNVLTKADSNLTGYNTPRNRREAAYYIGVHLKNGGNLDSAKTYFQDCINFSKISDTDEESGFQVNAVLYLARIYEAQGLKEEAIELYEKLLEMRDYGSSHSAAESALENLKKES